MAFGKYHPLVLENKDYSFPQSQFCYGLWNTKTAIERTKKAIIFEGEKSVMLLEDGAIIENNSISVFGSNISKTQILSLIKLGAREITIAFDKENIDVRVNQSSAYFNKLVSIQNSYSPHSSG